MARPRTPLKKAKTTGADIKHPERFSGRKEPKSKPLGNPSKHMMGLLGKDGLPDNSLAEMWEAFKLEIPWLMESDRTLVEIACNLRARLVGGEEVGVQALGQLRMCIGQMGGTPADRSKVSLPDGQEENKTDKYFN